MTTNNQNILILVFFLSSLLSFSQNSDHAKRAFIINKLKFAETIEESIKYKIESVKYRATGQDSIKLLELEAELSEKEISRRVNLAFDELFTSEEIEAVYQFLQSNAYYKIFNSNELTDRIEFHFDDFTAHLNKITMPSSEDNSEFSFEPIPVNRKDGFYETIIDLDNFIDYKDIQLVEEAVITKEDILSVAMETNDYNVIELKIALNAVGTEKFALFTAANIDKSIAIVVDNNIVYLPYITSIISDGNIAINGNFSKKEAEQLMLKLMKK